MPWPKLLPLARNLMGVGQASGTLIVMAGSAPPGNKELVPWRVKEIFSYEVQKKKRYFWALEFSSAPS